MFSYYLSLLFHFRSFFLSLRALSSAEHRNPVIPTNLSTTKLGICRVPVKTQGCLILHWHPGVKHHTLSFHRLQRSLDESLSPKQQHIPGYACRRSWKPHFRYLSLFSPLIFAHATLFHRHPPFIHISFGVG